MKIEAKDVFELRKITGLGINECKAALEKAGSISAAIELIKKTSKDIVIKPKNTKDGIIYSYIHDSKIGAMIELNCATDFVARTEEFKNLAKDICLHIVAITPYPLYLTVDDIPEDTKRILKFGATARGLSQEITEKIYESSLKSLAKNNCLLEQPFIKDPFVKISDLLKNLEIKVKEPISIARFVRFELSAFSDTTVK